LNTTALVNPTLLPLSLVRE